ncbi:MAG: 2Fe-2S iron-sulfur cluster-binding protein [Actinomycetota bacterium]|nr:2Fe-2S iron-sulfur cluster-binding protein [Actinomycetota bacterium]
MPTLDFEGTRVPVRDGDTVASALYRAGVRTFTRSTKYHRRRGLYCLSGDCPNCLVDVDGDPGCRACVTDASGGQRVSRGSGFPSADLDLLAVLDRAHRLMPVGFYYKTFIRPRFAWELAEKVIRRATGVGRLPVGRPSVPRATRHLRTEVLVIGGGVAGLASASAAADAGERVVLCDEGRLGEKVPAGPTLQTIRELADRLRAAPGATILERHPALGIYEGPLVPLVGPDGLVRVQPRRIVVATGAVESHGVFPGNDLPGVWLGRGAARMAGVHGLLPGHRIVVAAETREGLEHIGTLRQAGGRVLAALVPADLAPSVPDGVEAIVDGRIQGANGRRRLESVGVETVSGSRRMTSDALVLSLGLEPRDGLMRMASDQPVVGAGEVLLPGCSVEEARTSGARAAQGDPVEVGSPADPLPLGAGGYVCLCEDVGVADLERAWGEGWRSSEILKRYTTATMGPCQGALCGRHVAAFVRARSGSDRAGARTTARPPVRSVPLRDLAGGIDEGVEKRTALHDRHLELGAHLERSGDWLRPFRYGDVADEYLAVRERVSLMDVGTLGKFLVGGRDAQTLMDRVFPCRVTDLVPGRSRYLLTLGEAGYVMDDGLISALDGGRYYLTSTSGGADAMEAWLLDWADRWDLHVHVVNQTSMLGAINVAGPRARDLLARLTDDRIDAAAIPYPGHREITVAGVACRSLRVGFVGELSFELHHPRSRGVDLWNALLEAGADLGIRPHGLDALDMLRLEKGHVYLGQDTLPDDHPFKLGLDWAVALDKPAFVGKTALERMGSLPLDRKLVGLTFDGQPRRGVPLQAGTEIVGRVTSCATSPAMGHAIGLGWLRAVAGEFPTRLTAGHVDATVVSPPFYDPTGARLRA